MHEGLHMTDAQFLKAGELREKHKARNLWFEATNVDGAITLRLSVGGRARGERTYIISYTGDVMDLSFPSRRS